MLVVRPIKEEDFGQICSLLDHVPVGMTTLPHDPNILKKRIKKSLNSFRSMPEKPEGDLFFFVVEDTKKRKVAGTCALITKVGGFQPFYTYKIKAVLRESKVLGVRKEIRYLQLIVDHNGPSELATLFLSPEYRDSGNGRLLSLSRFLFIAQYPHCFEKTILAEMRGVIDEKGKSPFWEAVGKPFFEVDFEKADLMVMTDKSFIAELIPQHPIYIPLLPDKAQEVIGKVHEDTKPAVHLLKQEGFVLTDEIDIFEAGPVLTAQIKDIRTIQASQEAHVESISTPKVESPVYLIANVDGFQEFRVTRGSLVVLGKNKVQFSPEVARALKVKIGSRVRFVRLKP